MSATKQKIVFIINPISGNKGKEVVERNISTIIDNERYDVEIVRTSHKGHATDITRQAVKDNVDIVCAVGGDGTVNEVARSLVNTNTALAIVPFGSGNGLARHLQIPMESPKALRLINEGYILPMDYGLVNNTPFFCTCGVGFDAFISAKFSESGKRGPLTYMENVLRNGLNYNPETYELESEDEYNVKSTYKAFLISCANASQYGNNAFIAPQASVRDGLMDVTIIEPFNLVDAPAIAIQLFNGTIDTNSRIKTFQCRNLTIKRSKPGVIHFDGEPKLTGKTVKVKLIPKALRCVCAKEEGPMKMARNIQNFFNEQFYDVFYRSEELIETNPLLGHISKLGLGPKKKEE